MLCPSCQNFRPANSAPCPVCQSPSPLTNDAFQGNSWGEQSFTTSGAWSEQQLASSGAWGGPGTDMTGGWNNPAPMSPWQQSSNASQQLAFSNAAQQQDSAFWAQTGEQSPAQALLPVPYQEQFSTNSQALMAIQQPFPPLNQGFNPRVPALPDGPDAPVYVPPMYTKPRPLIPRHRAISGMLSVLIVFTLLCSGAGYYAQVTGKLVPLEKFLGIYTPPPASARHGLLKIPTLQAQDGPAATFIPSVAISNQQNTTVTKDTAIIRNEVNQFTAGETIYLICNFSSVQVGTVTTKWYNDNNLYRVASTATKDSQSNGIYFTTVYAKATEGKVEVYWNGQLAKTVFFVVQPAA